MCVFCDIINGIIPSKKIYEDEMIISILDISQTTYGHILVIPKKHYDNFSICPKETLKHLMDKVQDIALYTTNKLKANGYNILINTNEIAGQTVQHLHVHIIPRYDKNDSFKIDFKTNEYNLDEIIEKINH